jgi:hypothetical protein
LELTIIQSLKPILSSKVRVLYHPYTLCSVKNVMSLLKAIVYFSGETGSRDDRAQYLHQFVLHAALDAVEEQQWQTTNMSLGVVDKFNHLQVVKLKCCSSYQASFSSARWIMYRPACLEHVQCSSTDQ